MSSVLISGARNRKILAIAGKIHSCGIKLWSEHQCTSFLLQVAATLLHLSHTSLTKGNVLQNCSCSLQHRQGQSGAGWGMEWSGSEGGLEKAEKEQSKESEDGKEISSDYRSYGMEVGPDPASQQCHLTSFLQDKTSLLSVWVSWLSPDHSAEWSCVHGHVEAMRRQQCCSACRTCSVLQDHVGWFPLRARGSSVKLPGKASACCGGLQDLLVQLAPGYGWVSACIPWSMLGYNVFYYMGYFSSYLLCLLWRQVITYLSCLPEYCQAHQWESESKKQNRRELWFVRAERKTGAWHGGQKSKQSSQPRAEVASQAKVVAKCNPLTWQMFLCWKTWYPREALRWC